MRILGISAYYHDAAAALLIDGQVAAAAQEERFTRKKHDANFPTNALRYCVKEAGVAWSDIDFVTFYEKPFLKFERLLETYLAFAPKGDEALLTHPGEVLRERRLRQTHGLREGIHVALAAFDQVAQDHQPALVGERAQNAGNLKCLLFEEL